MKIVFSVGGKEDNHSQVLPSLSEDVTEEEFAKGELFHTSIMGDNDFLDIL